MTTKPTPEQIQRACDLANAGCGVLRPWFPSAYGENGCLTALADTIAQLDTETARADLATNEASQLRAELAFTQTELGKARTDLAEIDRLLQLNTIPNGSPIWKAVDIAAPYRVETDPLVEAFRAIHGKDMEGGVEWSVDIARRLSAELAKRGLEIGRSA